jgi:hypothetical protein
MGVRGHKTKPSLESGITWQSTPSKSIILLALGGQSTLQGICKHMIIFMIHF